MLHYRTTPQRAFSIAFVAVLHIAAIYALVAALVPQVRIPLPHGPIVLLRPDQSHDFPARPPLKEVFAKPVAPVAEPPPVDYARDENALSGGSTSGAQSNDVTASADVPLRGIADTHTTPPYPASSLRLGEQGTVRLLLTVSDDGTVLNAIVEHSSGSYLLDRAAVDWVRKHWRYHPQTRSGVAVSATTETDIRFDIRNAR